MLGWQLQQLFTAAGRPAKHFPSAPARAKPVFYRRLQSKHFRPTARLGFEILKLVSSDVPGTRCLSWLLPPFPHCQSHSNAFLCERTQGTQPNPHWKVQSFLRTFILKDSILHSEKGSFLHLKNGERRALHWLQHGPGQTLQLRFCYSLVFHSSVTITRRILPLFLGIK